MTVPGVGVWNLNGGKVDPFGTLPISMPFKSQELLRYCKLVKFRFLADKCD